MPDNILKFVKGEAATRSSGSWIPHTHEAPLTRAAAYTHRKKTRRQTDGDPRGEVVKDVPERIWKGFVQTGPTFPMMVRSGTTSSPMARRSRWGVSRPACIVLARAIRLGLDSTYVYRRRCLRSRIHFLMAEAPEPATPPTFPVGQREGAGGSRSQDILALPGRRQGIFTGHGLPSQAGASRCGKLSVAEQKAQQHPTMSSARTEDEFVQGSRGARRDVCRCPS